MAKELEGTWNGTLGGSAERVVLVLANQADGTAIGHVVNLDEGGLRFPVANTQNGSGLTLDLKVVGASYAATFNADRGELIGTYTQGALSAPLTFRRAVATDTKR